MAEPGTVIIKVFLDTEEAEAKLVALQAKAANLQAYADAPAWCTGLPDISRYIVDIAGKLSGCTISPRDSAYLIDCIRSRTRD